MGTTDHGFVYPESTGAVVPWEDLQNLAESVEDRFVTDEAWTSWVPAWTSGGFSSVGGSGLNEGFYCRVGDLVHAEFRIELASGFAVTGGTMALILPVAAFVWGGSGIQSALGAWTARDDSVPYHYSGTLGQWSAAGTGVTFNGVLDAADATGIPRIRMDSNDPIATWAAGDVLAGVLDYRAA